MEYDDDIHKAARAAAEALLAGRPMPNSTPLEREAGHLARTYYWRQRLDQMGPAEVAIARRAGLLGRMNGKPRG
jgi:hypothetical protein